MRTSALLHADGERILFDCGPDFRQQMLSVDFQRLSAIFITHVHADHVCGLDDLRPGRIFGEVNIYAESRVCKNLRERLPYCFIPKEQRYPGVPALNLHEIQPHVPVKIGAVEVLPLRVIHGRLPILGFRVGDLAYITDMSALPDGEIELLRGVKLLIVNALRPWWHPSHQTVEDAIALSEELGCPPTYLIHLTHDIRPHRIFEPNLPPHVHLGYDGLSIPVPSSPIM